MNDRTFLPVAGGAGALCICVTSLSANGNLIPLASISSSSFAKTEFSKSFCDRVG